MPPDPVGFPARSGWAALERFLSSAPFPALVWAEDGEVLLTNEALLAATGFAADQVGTLEAWTELAYGQAAGPDPARVARLGAAGGHIPGGECEIRTANGRRLSWRVSEVALGPGPNGRLLFATMAHDLTERRAVESDLRERALGDRLTGLYSRRHLAEQVAAAVAIADRYGQPLTLCLCDLDGFAARNEEHGHEVGDATLKRFAEILREQLRAADIPARAGGLPGRMGGDEFGVVFPYTPGDGALVALRRVAKALAAEGAVPPATASFGVAQWRQGVDAGGLFAAAAALLREAQEAGPGNIRIG